MTVANLSESPFDGRARPGTTTIVVSLLNHVVNLSPCSSNRSALPRRDVKRGYDQHQRSTVHLSKCDDFSNAFDLSLVAGPTYLPIGGLVGSLPAVLTAPAPISLGKFANHWPPTVVTP